MSAGTYYYDVSCDYLDRAAPLGQQRCPERIKDLGTKAEGRREARKRGWTVGVHSNNTERGGLFDYCPEHKPGATS